MKRIFAVICVSLIVCQAVSAQDEKRIGIIGLDTSHSVAFTELINGSGEEWTDGFRVVAAYPYGSRTIESSYKRIDGYIEKVKAYGVVIVESISELLETVDFVMLETNDGRLHPEQALEVFRAGKTCFIDKPLGATLGDAVAIYELAEEYGIPVFSSSALRFSSGNAKIKAGEYGDVFGADCYSHHTYEPTHPDFGFYGIHGVESLYTIMGTGCREVSRMSSETGDVVTGLWDDGRIGTFRAVVKGPYGFGGTVLTEKGFVPAGTYEGYKCLLKEILDFFRTGKSPVAKEETIEIFTFMKASNMSKERGGRLVSMSEAYNKGRKDAAAVKRRLIK